MRFTRRRLTALVIGALLATPGAFAQSRYPSKPIKFVVPFAPGGGSDAYARLISSKLAEAHGYTVVVENRPGAGGNLGAESALREPADGHALLVISGSYAGNAVVNKPSFDPVGAIQPVIQFTREPMVAVVSTTTSADTLPKLIAKAKAAPGTVAYGSSGAGGLAHLATEYFASLAGIKLNHVPYKGTAAALNDLMGGQIELLFGGSSTFVALAKTGKVRAIAVDGSARLPSLPDTPTFAEAGLPRFDVDLWHGLVAPKGTPKDIVTKLNTEINAILHSPAVKARMAADGVDPAGGTPEQFALSIRKDMDRWRQLVKSGTVKLENQ